MDKNMKTDRPELTFRPSREQLDSWNKDLNSLMDDSSLSATMKMLACIVDEYDTRKMDHLQCQIYHKALDWLATLKAKLESFRAVEYQSGSADSDGDLVPGTEYVKYMVYNTDVVSCEDAEDILKHGRQDLDDRVVTLWPSQAFALFPALRERQAENG